MDPVHDPEVRSSALETRPDALAEEPELEAHPGPRTYILVAVALAVATLIEVGLYYLDLPHAVLAALLLFFSFIKFSLVALWFMHLRFDNPLFRRLFMTGMFLAVTVYMVVLVTFGALKAPWLLAPVVLVIFLVPVLVLLRGRRTSSEVAGGATAGRGA